MPPTKSTNITILGAGVFGLSTAYHLSRRGYTNIHLFDSNPYHQTHYSFPNGATGASSDENKILRASYGDRKLYQDLAFEAMPEWDELDSRLEKMDVEGLRDGKKLWWKCGYARLNSLTDGLEKTELLTQENFPQEMRGTQYRVSCSEDLLRAERDGIPGSKLDPLGRRERGLSLDGVLDMTAGFVLAARACAFFLHLCELESPNISLHLGGEENTFSELVFSPGDRSKVVGFKTADGGFHVSELLILATGGWTPSLFPPVSELLETTSGSVVCFHLERELAEKWSCENMPVWDWNMGEGYIPPHERLKKEGGERGKGEEGETGGIYALPCLPPSQDEDGPWVFKLAFRGAKWTSYPSLHPSTNLSNSNIEKIAEPTSTPLLPPSGTRHKIPKEALQTIHSFARTNLPELLDLEPEYVRLCWYTDSVDNSFLVDYVPKSALSNTVDGEQGANAGLFEAREIDEGKGGDAKDTGLFICTGGSGHGFKFLPILGKKVVDVIEGVGSAELRDVWGWEGKERKKADGSKKWNGLEEGVCGWRNLEKQEMVGREAWREMRKR